MGIFWKFMMVLLSTLAALVIIVNSAEEEYEAQYRRDLRPRISDTGTSRNFEQPWRTVDVIKQSTPEDIWMDSSTEEPPRRRRLGRKRKRRPDTHTSEEVLLSQEPYGYPAEPARSYLDVDVSMDERKISDTPKRRKKFDAHSNRREPPRDEDRPIRRRGQRRKRPSIETWPELSEFGDIRPDEAPRDINGQSVDHIDTVGTDDDYRHFDYQDNTQTHVKPPENYRPPIEETFVKPNGEEVNYLKSPDNRKQYTDRGYSPTDYIDDTSKIRRLVNDDRSLSEFTNEDMSSAHAQTAEEEKHIIREKIMNKSLGYFKDISKAQDNGPIDALTLKDILKRSNGTSLSEILQQHNLSLADLLHGKEHVISILKSEDSLERQVTSPAPKLSGDLIEIKPVSEISTGESGEDKLLVKSETKYAQDPLVKNVTANGNQNVELDTTTVEVEKLTTETSKVEDAPKRPNIRRFPTSIRRKQRIRPILNNTYKSQISRDMIALNARKYFNNRRRNTTHEWRDLIPVVKKNISIEDLNKTTEIETTTVNIAFEETTILQDVENCTKVVDLNYESDTSESLEDIQVIAERQNKTDTEVDIVQSTVSQTDKPIVITTTPQVVNASGLRRQAFNNRLKKKRLRQKNLTTEPPQDDILLNIFGIPNLVSSSEFIAQTQRPKTSIDDISMLEDFITTEVPRKHENRTKTTRYSTPRAATTPQFIFVPSTEESAKIEIEEILNDTQTSARLSKILMERNMTLSELVEHRERGSSHVHLADIFHNASKEPNPPEPFLSKSLIEPISKETYPLIALLEANIHETTAKATTIDSVTTTAQTTETNIPVIMDFGNNVNENAENMGIMSLFHNITKNKTDVDKANLMRDSQGTFYETTITVVNTTDVQNASDTVRESRVIHVLNDNQEDVVSWNDIFTLMRKNYENNTEDLTNGLIPAENIKKPALEDVDGDGLIVLEDLQHLKDFDSNIASASVSNENLDANSYESAEAQTKAPGILDKIPSQTKSVTIATASIAGLAMVMFLLTYVGYRWQQQRTMVRKKSFPNEHVPTPVFENMKSHKNNSSSRSISPMLSTSNIYTLNTLDSRNGKESPDYMWDSLRKPFQ